MRRFFKLIEVALRELGRRKIRSVLTVLAVSVGAGSIFVLLSLSDALKNVVVGQLSRDLSLTEIVVTPKFYSIGPVKFQNQNVKLDDATVSELLSKEGVVSVAKQRNLKFPASLKASLFGQSLFTDTGVYGVDAGWLEPDASGGVNFSSTMLEKPVPVVLSSKLVDMYNLGFAEGSGLPRLDQKIIVGRHMYLDLGVSSFTSKDGTILRSIKGKIVGTSNRVSLMGVSVPIAWVEHWNAILGDDSTNDAYSSLIVKVASADMLNQTIADIKAMGFDAEAGMDLAKKVSSALKYLTVASLSIGILIFVLVGVALSFALFLNVREGRTKIAVYRALGAKRRDIREIFLFQAFSIGIVGTLVGIIIGIGVVMSIRSVLLAKLLAFAPEIQHALGFSWTALAISFGFPLLCSFISGIVPAARAASSSPVDILRTM